MILSGCGGGSSSAKSSDSSKSDDTSDSKIVKRVFTPKIVSIDSTNASKITVFWLASSQESITYEVHLSTKENFTPDKTTLKQSLIDINEADIEKLSPNTTYYAKILAINSKNEKATSNEMSVKTAKSNPKLAINKNKIKKQDDLNSKLLDVKEDSITFDGDADIKTDDVLIGTKENPYLRKVISVSKSNGKTEVQTRQAAITEVVSDAKISSKTVLFQNNEVKSSRGISRSVKYSSNQKDTISTWKSGRFSVSSSQTLKPKNIKSRNLKKSNDFFEFTVFSDKDIQISANETLNIDFLVLMKQFGIDDKVEITNVGIKSLEHPDKGSSFGDFGERFELSYYDQKIKALGTFIWTPNNTYASKKPYVATLMANVKDKECGDDDKCQDETKEIKIYITVVGDGKIETGGVPINITYSKEGFTTEIDYNFEPILNIDHTIEDASLKHAKIELGGKLTFDILNTFKIENGIDKTYPVKNIIKPIKYESVYIVGPAIIYQEIEFTLDGELTATAQGSIEATSDLDSSLEIRAGMEYKNGRWEEISKHEPRKDYTATVKTKGGVELEVRLIPNLEIKFYKIASAGISVEPWAKGEIEASATAKYNTDLEQQDILGLYKLEKLDIDLGIEGKVYADLTVWEWNLAHYPDGGDKKTIFNPEWNIFSLPKIQIDTPSDVCKPFDLLTKIEDGTNNLFDYEHTSWRIFPETGSSIKDNGTSANISFNKKDEYEIYFVGNSQKLGTIFGKQYESIKVDTRDCEFKIENKTCKDDNYNCPVCKDNEVLKYKDDGSGYCEVKIIDEPEPTEENHKPIAKSKEYTINQDTTLDITLEASDEDGDNLTYEIGTPKHGKLEGTAPNLIYSPDSEFSGKDTFAFKVYDGKEWSVLKFITINVKKEEIIEAKITSLSPTSVNLNESTTFTILGENLPSSIAMALQDGECGNVNYISSSKATILCTPKSSGEKSFYVAKKSHGEAINSDVDLKVNVKTINDNVNFSSENYTTSNIFYNNGYAPKSQYPKNSNKSKLGDSLGNCTWYAHGRMKELGYNSGSLNKMSGNATTWADTARSNNIVVNSIPEVGSIAQATASNENYTSYGHVAVVEEVYKENQTLLISESSYTSDLKSSWNFKYRTRIVTWDEFDNYIHINKELPTLTLLQVEDIQAGEEAIFKASLSKSLEDKYSVKLSLGDGGGGYLEPIAMQVNADKTIFTLSQTISKAGNRKYRVAIFEGDVKVSSWVDGTYIVNEEEIIFDIKEPLDKKFQVGENYYEIDYEMGKKWVSINKIGIDKNKIDSRQWLMYTEQVPRRWEEREKEIYQLIDEKWIRNSKININTDGTFLLGYINYKIIKTEDISNNFLSIPFSMHDDGVTSDVLRMFFPNDSIKYTIEKQYIEDTYILDISQENQVHNGNWNNFRKKHCTKKDEYNEGKLFWDNNFFFDPSTCNNAELTNGKVSYTSVFGFEDLGGKWKKIGNIFKVEAKYYSYFTEYDNKIMKLKQWNERGYSRQIEVYNEVAINAFKRAMREVE